MADEKLIELTEEENPTADALVYVVNDPEGTPVDRKIQLANAPKGMPHNNLGSLQGGTADEYYHLLEAEYTELSEWLDNVTLGSGGVTSIPQLVLIPSAAAIEAIEGGVFYNSGDKSLYVCTDV